MALILIYPFHDPSLFLDDLNLFDINPNNYTLFVTTSWLTLIMSYPCDPGKVFVSVLLVFVSVPIEGFGVLIFVSLLTEGFTRGTETRPQRPDFPQTDESIVSSKR